MSDYEKMDDLQGVVISMLLHKLGLKEVVLTKEDYNEGVVGYGVLIELNPTDSTIRLVKSDAEAVQAHLELATKHGEKLN